MNGRACLVVVVALALSCGWLGPAQGWVPTNRCADEIQDVVFVGGPAPLLIRFHVQIDGKPFRAARAEYLDRVFKHLDRDGDGHLSASEIQRLPPPSVLFSANRSGAPHAERIAQLVKAAADTKFDRERTIKYFFGSEGGVPFQSQGSASAVRGYPLAVDFDAEVRLWDVSGRQPDAPNGVLFRLLDANQDGKLSAQELSNGPARLARHDTDDDEIIAQEELVRRPAISDYVIVDDFSYSMVRSGGGRAWALAVNPGDLPDVLGQRLLERYRPTASDPKNPPQKLSSEHLRLEPEEFSRLDRDKDGLLDKDELGRFAEGPPHLQFRLSLGRDTTNPVLEPLSSKDRLERADQAGHSWMLRQGGLGVLFTLERPNPKNGQPRPGLLANVKNTFKNLDRDKNKYLDRKEARGSSLLNDLFPVMDKDGDGQLFENEIAEFLSPWAELRDLGDQTCVSLSSSEESKGLFDLLDTNGDGRLSVRELRRLPGMLQTHDHDKDGSLVKGEFPRTFTLVLRQGPAEYSASAEAYASYVRAVAFSVDGTLTRASPPAKEPTAGPAWFRKMDRNRDSDLSRREFLGSAEEFGRIDSDGDGLISAAEAERFDAQMRNKR